MLFIAITAYAIITTAYHISDPYTCQQMGLNNCLRCTNKSMLGNTTYSHKPLCYQCSQGTYDWENKQCIHENTFPDTVGKEECRKGNYWSFKHSQCKPCSFEAAGCIHLKECCNDVRDFACTHSFTINITTSRCECEKGDTFVILGICYGAGLENVYLTLNKTTNVIINSPCIDQCEIGCQNYKCPFGTYQNGCQCLPLHYSCKEGKGSNEKDCTTCQAQFQMRKINGSYYCLCPGCTTEINGECISNENAPYLTSESVCVSYSFPQSSIINFTEFRQIAEWVCGISSQKYILLYRGSRDGFTSSNFHKHCDQVSSLLVVIRDTNMNIFGYYTPLKYTSTQFYVVDYSMQTFLFSLQSMKKYPINNGEYAIFDSSEYGPSLGSGFDICIVDNCNSVNSNYRFPSSFNYSMGYELGLGQNYFTVEEIEVYQVNK